SLIVTSANSPSFLNSVRERLARNAVSRTRKRVKQSFKPCVPKRSLGTRMVSADCSAPATLTLLRISLVASLSKCLPQGQGGTTHADLHPMARPRLLANRERGPAHPD